MQVLCIIIHLKLVRLYQKIDTSNQRVISYHCADCYSTEKTKHAVRLANNLSGRFESRWSRVVVEESRSILLKDMAGAKLGIWVAHGEGQFWRMGVFMLDTVLYFVGLCQSYYVTK